MSEREEMLTALTAKDKELAVKDQAIADMARTISELRGRLKKLQNERRLYDAEVRSWKLDHDRKLASVRNRATRLQRERDEARAALKPMAEVAKDIPDDWDDDHQCVTACGHFRRAARAVIEQGE